MAVYTRIVSSLIASNKKAKHDYAITSEYEAGIELRGTEVKSIRAGHINLRESFARVEKGEVILYQCHIKPWSSASFQQHDSDRPRKLLLHKSEIRQLYAATEQKGCTILPLRAYWKGPYVKIALGVGKGKEKGDKRQALKEKVAKRESDRAMANFNKRK